MIEYELRRSLVFEVDFIERIAAAARSAGISTVLSRNDGKRNELIAALIGLYLGELAPFAIAIEACEIFPFSTDQSRTQSDVALAIGLESRNRRIRFQY